MLTRRRRCTSQRWSRRFGRLLANWLFGIPPITPLTFAAAAALFAVVGMVAHVPVRRATRISPVDALRHD